MDNKIITDKDKDIDKVKLINSLKERDEKIKNEIIDIVLRQTDLDRDDATKRLEASKYNFHKVIKEYMNPNDENKNTSKIKNLNVQQTIYKEIRNMMDSSERNRRFQQELTKRSEEMNN